MEHSGGCGASGTGGLGRGCGEEGEGRLWVPRNIQPSWLAGDRAGNCTACARRGERTSEACWSWGLPEFLGAVFLAHRNGEREMSSLQWLPENTFISGTQCCLRLLCILMGK